MKYLHDIPKVAIENINRAAWIRKLGRAKRPEDVTEFLCGMFVSDDETAAELHVRPEDEEFFSAGDRARMNNNQTIIPTEEI